MTQPQIPDPDELASAVLDGAATPEEAALVAADPALTARVEALRAARDRLRSAEAAPVDPERREIAIAAALAAFDELERGDAGREPVVAPVPLAARRRPGSVPRVWRYVAIAAAIVAGVLVVPLIGGLDGGDEEDLEDFASEMPERTTTMDASADGSEAAGVGDAALDEPMVAPDPAEESAPALGGPRLVPHLGAFEDVAALELAVVEATGQPSGGSATDDQGQAAPACEEPIVPVEDGAVVLELGATLVDAEVTVLVLERPDGSRTVRVLDGACAVVHDAPLPPG